MAKERSSHKLGFATSKLKKVSTEPKARDWQAPAVPHWKRTAKEGLDLLTAQTRANNWWYSHSQFRISSCQGWATLGVGQFSNLLMVTQIPT